MVGMVLGVDVGWMGDPGGQLGAKKKTWTGPALGVGREHGKQL